MAFGLVTAGLAIASSVFGAVSSAAAARQQNAAISTAQKSQVEAVRVQQNQLAQQAAVEKQKRILAAQQIEGRLRVAAAEAGVGLGGSFAALSRQNAGDLSINQQIIDSNFNNNVALIRSGARANIAQLGANYQNPILAGFTGGAGGLNTGLAIGGAIQTIGDLMTTPVPQPYSPAPRPRL